MSENGVAFVNWQKKTFRSPRETETAAKNSSQVGEIDRFIICINILRLLFKETLIPGQ